MKSLFVRSQCGSSEEDWRDDEGSIHVGAADAQFRQKQPLDSDMRHHLPSGKVLKGRKSTL